MKLAFGVLLLLLLLLLGAMREWRARPAAGEETPMPSWMKGIDAFTAPKALGLSAHLGALNPKNLLLGAAAGTTIAQAYVSSSERWGAWLIFVLLASLTVGIPVLDYLLGGEGAQQRLDSWKTWLQQNNAAVMAVVLLVLGAVLVGQSIQTLRLSRGKDWSRSMTRPGSNAGRVIGEQPDRERSPGVRRAGTAAARRSPARAATADLRLRRRL